MHRSVFGMQTLLVVRVQLARVKALVEPLPRSLELWATLGFVRNDDNGLLLVQLQWSNQEETAEIAQ